MGAACVVTHVCPVDDYGINAPARIADALNLVKIGRWAIDGFEMRNVLLFDNYRIDDTPSVGVVPMEIEHVLRMIVADRQQEAVDVDGSVE